MSDILIRGMEMPSEPTAITLFPNGDVYDFFADYKYGTAVQLPPHGDLIDRDAVEYTYAFHTGVLMTSNKILDKLPTIVGADKELLEKANKEFIEEASKNRAVKYEQEVKSMRDVALELRDEAREIKNGNVPFPERSGK